MIGGTGCPAALIRAVILLRMLEDAEEDIVGGAVTSGAADELLLVLLRSCMDLGGAVFFKGFKLEHCGLFASSSCTEGYTCLKFYEFIVRFSTVSLEIPRMHSHMGVTRLNSV